MLNESVSVHVLLLQATAPKLGGFVSFVCTHSFSVVFVFVEHKIRVASCFAQLFVGNECVLASIAVPCIDRFE